MRQKLNLITLGVVNFQKSSHFYEKGLGWKKSDKSLDDLALFDLGGIILALHPLQELADDTTLTYQIDYIFWPDDFTQYKIGKRSGRYFRNGCETWCDNRKACTESLLGRL